jgi:hypothetical protein
LLFKILLSGIRSNPERARKRATFSRSPSSAGLAYSSPCRSCFSTSTFRVTGSKTSPLLVRMMPSSCAKRAPRHAGSGEFTKFSVILPLAARATKRSNQMRSLIPHVGLGSSTDLTAPKSNFRSSPESGLKSDIGPCPFRANSRHSQSFQSVSRPPPTAEPLDLKIAVRNEISRTDQRTTIGAIDGRHRGGKG